MVFLKTTHSVLFVGEFYWLQMRRIVILLLISCDVELNCGPVTFQKTLQKVRCPTCDDLIQEVRGIKKGQDAIIFCDGTYQAWMHRQCTGLTKVGSESLVDSIMDFFCLKGCLTTLESVVCDLKNQLQAVQEIVAEVSKPTSQSFLCYKSKSFLEVKGNGYLMTNSFPEVEGNGSSMTNSFLLSKHGDYTFKTNTFV